MLLDVLNVDNLKLNDEVEIVGLRPTTKAVVTGIEMFRKSLDYAQAGDNAGCLLRGIARDGVERGQVLAKPGSVTPHTKFKASVYVLSKEEGGRHTPFFSNYRPQFYFRTTDVTGVIELPEGVEMVMPGDNVEMTVELIAPVALENGTKFSRLNCDKKNMIIKFWDMFVVDTLIGNVDRHLSNFGFIITYNNIDFAPIYDCGSTLHPLLSDEKK